MPRCCATDAVVVGALVLACAIAVGEGVVFVLGEADLADIGGIVADVGGVLLLTLGVV